ncbi:centromere-associated protein [Salix suchowensis]|nr:centromere-associated protein [Salix suchowensis]
MDKNKSRTDLLAAGRKKVGENVDQNVVNFAFGFNLRNAEEAKSEGKNENPLLWLQQFRQKKDSKGSSSHGRSKKNSSVSEKHESDADEASSTGNAAGLKQVREWEVKSQSDSDSGRVDSLVSSGAPDVNVDVVAVDPPIPLTAETRVAETALGHDAGSAVEEGWVDENHIDSSKPYEGESSQSIDDKAARVVPLGNSDIPDSEAKTKHDDAFLRCMDFGESISFWVCDIDSNFFERMAFKCSEVMLFKFDLRSKEKEGLPTVTLQAISEGRLPKRKGMQPSRSSKLHSKVSNFSKLKNFISFTGRKLQLSDEA